MMIDPLYHRVNLNSLDAVIISHAHKDHCGYIRQFVDKWPTKIYATEATFKHINNWIGIDINYKQTIEIDKFYENDKIKIEFFANSHDIEGAVIYRITNKATAEKLTFITDTGKILLNYKKIVEESDYLLLEANYDADIIDETAINLEIKKRVISDVGHLSIQDAQAFINDLTIYAGPIVLIHKSVKNMRLESYNEVLLKTNVMIAKNGLILNLNKNIN